jgi:hypothetical protein
MEFKMKTAIIKSSLLAITFVSIFAISNSAISDDSIKQKTNDEISSISVEANHPLAMAHLQLKQAHKNLTEGKTEALSENLKTAKKWLQDPSLSKDKKTQSEAKLLREEIQQLQKENSQNKEGAIARLWHRSSALLKREVTQLSTSWHDSSLANETLKYLIDARLHFNYARHDLFVSHEADKVKNEIAQTFAYLDKAKKNANPEINKKIIIIQNDIKYLLTDHAKTKEEQAIIKALSIANKNMLKVSQNTSSEIKTMSQNIAQKIIDLRKNIIILEKHEQYNDIMKRLESLDKQL